jgi:hypothetical protein
MQQLNKYDSVKQVYNMEKKEGCASMIDQTHLEDLQRQIKSLEAKIDFLIAQKEPQLTPLWLCFVYGFLSVLGLFIIPPIAIYLFQLIRALFI